MRGSSWMAPVSRWVLWEASTGGSDAPSSTELAFIDPMLRRRLSRQAKMTLFVGHQCAHDQIGVRFVYASRHGELARTTAMLNDLANSEALSPTAFSMSVLSATPGLFSILQENTAPSTAISAGLDSFGCGLLEACLQLKAEPEQPVLLVYADEALPAVYGESEMSDFKAHAVGLLLQTGAAVQVECHTCLSADELNTEPDSRAFFRCLEEGRTNWNWNKCRP
jgi:hypothetical protein